MKTAIRLKQSMAFIHWLSHQLKHALAMPQEAALFRFLIQYYVQVQWLWTHTYRLTRGINLYENGREEDCGSIEHSCKNTQALFCMTFFIASLKQKNEAYTLSFELMELKCRLLENILLQHQRNLGLD